MTDRASGQDPLVDAWVSLCRRLGVVLGTLTAIVSLLAGVSVMVASLRGGLACLAVLVVCRVGSFLHEKIKQVTPEDESQPVKEEPTA